MSGSWSVIIEDRGREGTVRYSEPQGAIECYHEIGGGSAVASVRVGTEAEWLARHPWAVARRAEILERIGSELVRQRAPSCSVLVDEESGWMHLVPRGGPPAPPPAPGPSFGTESPPPPPPGAPAAPAPSQPGPNSHRSAGGGSAPPAPPPPASPLERAAQFHRRFSATRAKFALAGGVTALACAALLWLGRSALSIDTSGSPFGDSVRTGNTIATMVSHLDPHLPSLHRDPSKDTYSLGILLQAADGSSTPRVVWIARRLSGSTVQHCRLIGADPSRIWFRGPEPGALSLGTLRVLTEAEYAAVQALAPPLRADPSDLATGDDALLRHLAAGGVVAPTRFMALLSQAEATRSFKPGSTAKEVVPAERTSDPLFLWIAAVQNDGGRQRLDALQARPDAPIHHAMFLRASRNGPLLVLAAPVGLLRIHQTDRYRTGTVIVSRLDQDGGVLWEQDLGIARLEQALPDATRPAFIGTRPAAPSTVPEPILVVVDVGTGAVATQSLLVGR